MLRRCHTARPYPRDQSSLIDGVRPRTRVYNRSFRLRALPSTTPITLKRQGKGHLQLTSSSDRIQPDRPRPPLTTASRYTANMAPVFNSLLVLLSCVVLGYAHNIQLRAHSRECFHEMLHADDRMTVTFQVGDREFGGSGNLDLDFWVSWIVSCSVQRKWHWR